MTTIPYDMYDTDQELIIIAPFGWVDKESVAISIQHEIITIEGVRSQPPLPGGSRPLQTQSYRWPIELSIDLPPESNYKDMTSTLTKDNILILSIPKNIIPDTIPLHIEQESDL